jgi:hypothetical protein
MTRPTAQPRRKAQRPNVLVEAKGVEYELTSAKVHLLSGF